MLSPWSWARMGVSGTTSFPSIGRSPSVGSHFFRERSLLVGFALITRGSPASNDPDVFDVAEFFVVRRHRRSGVGRRAAFLFRDRFAARWIVRVSEANQSGLQFWTSVIAEYTGGTPAGATRPGSPNAWRVFTFDSVGLDSGLSSPHRLVIVSVRQKQATRDRRRPTRCVEHRARSKCGRACARPTRVRPACPEVSALLLCHRAGASEFSQNMAQFPCPIWAQR
jgi:predicted acetyltransferase